MSEIKITMPDGTDQIITIPEGAKIFCFGFEPVFGRHCYSISRPKVVRCKWEKHHKGLIDFTLISDNYYTRQELLDKGIEVNADHWHPVEGSEVEE